MPDNESILLTIRKMIGPDSDYNVFDTDLITHLNSEFMVLAQAGVGPRVPFRITGTSETWTDFSSDIALIEGVKTYLYLAVKCLFDPSASSTVQTAQSEKAQEYLWRLAIQAETPAHDVKNSIR